MPKPKRKPLATKNTNQQNTDKPIITKKKQIQKSLKSTVNNKTIDDIKKHKNIQGMGNHSSDPFGLLSSNKNFKILKKEPKILEQENTISSDEASIESSSSDSYTDDIQPNSDHFSKIKFIH